MGIGVGISVGCCVRVGSGEGVLEGVKVRVGSAVKVGDFSTDLDGAAVSVLRFIPSIAGETCWQDTNKNNTKREVAIIDFINFYFSEQKITLAFNGQLCQIPRF